MAKKCIATVPMVGHTNPEVCARIAWSGAGIRLKSGSPGRDKKQRRRSHGCRFT